MSGTAEVHPEATLTPGKVELVAAWLPKQAWYKGSDASDAERVASFRFVDPYGEVGIETLLIRSDGVVYQVPLTYRSEPLGGAEEFLVGEMEHSVLGHRWAYDGTGDPVYVDELLRIIREGDDEAALNTGAPKSMTVRGSGVVMVSNSTGQMKLYRTVDPAPPTMKRVAVGTLEGTWTLDGVERTTLLASLY
jgi:Maltokinase N-terminal cap domain